MERVYCDSAMILRQLGLIPAVPAAVAGIAAAVIDSSSFMHDHVTDAV